MNGNPDIEQRICSRTAKGIYKTGPDSIRIMKCLAHNDRSPYVIINYFNLLESVLTCPNEIPERLYLHRSKGETI